MRISLQVAAFAIFATLTGLTVSADDPGFFPADAAAAPAQSQARLEQLLAPIALYPDSLLTQVLVASTYPLEVVALHRWLEQHPGLSGAELELALEAQPWDASVKALAPLPRIVATLNEQLDWMQSLGNAFLAQQADVMDAVQRLRARAASAGTLQDDARVRVAAGEDGAITVEYAEPETVYVPIYDPRVVYGPWVWPEYPPYYWGPWYDPWAFYVGGIYFGYGVRVGSSWRSHPHPDWHGHHVVDHRPGTPAWRHDPSHRGGVPYPDLRTRQRYISPGREASRPQGDFRGFEPRHAPATRSPFRPEANPAARAQSERGHSSLGPSRAPPASRSSTGASAPRSQRGAPPASSRANPAQRGSPSGKTR